MGKRLRTKYSEDISGFNSLPSSFNKPTEKKKRSLARNFGNKRFDSSSFRQPEKKSSNKRNQSATSFNFSTSPPRKKRVLGRRPADSRLQYHGMRATKRKKLEKGHKDVVPDRREQQTSALNQFIAAMGQSRAPRRHNPGQAVIESQNRHRSKRSSLPKVGASLLSVPCEISTKGKKNPLKDLQVDWFANEITSHRHTDYKYGCRVISKANKQELGGMTFSRNSNSCWELELTSKTEALEVSFCEDFLVFRVKEKAPHKRTLEIGFMHWCQKVRITMDTGRNEFNDFFPIDLQTSRFKVKKAHVSTLKLISKFNEAFVSSALTRLTSIQNAVHQAVIDEYKKFVETLKPFISIAPLVRTIWCFAATPAVLGTRAMCELRDRISRAFSPDGFNVVTLAPALGKFRGRALEDLVQGAEADLWVAKACKRVGDFEKVLANEAGLRKED